MIGKVVKKNASIFTVQDSEFNEYICHSRKKIKQTNNILVGDDVEFILENNSYVIENIKERFNSLIRPSVANIDTVIIVQSVIEPSINIFQLNQYLAYYEYQNVKHVLIYFSKLDLCDKQKLNEVNQIIDCYKNDGYQCLLSNQKDLQKTIDNLFLDKHIICLAGESGVGKSTLINNIIPNSNITTNQISKSLNRGKHTTTTSNLIRYKNGYIVDTPGFGSIELNIPNEEIAKSYRDFCEYSKKCKFRNCLHINEKDCEVKRKVSENKIWIQRYNTYVKLIQNNKYKVRY